MREFRNYSIVEIERYISTPSKNVVLDGKNLSIRDIMSVARTGSTVALTHDSKILQKIKKSHLVMMDDIKKGIPIYGANTGFGGRASHVVNKGTPDERLKMARKISDGIIHVDITTGPEFEQDIVRGGILIRINMLMQGVSAVKSADLEIYRMMLNAGITPIVNQYGGVGASGDLHHNGRVLSAARRIKGTKVRNRSGEILEASDALEKAGILKLVLDPKAGLGFVNGDNFSTSLATALAYDTLQALLIAQVTESMVIEVLRGTNRSFHPLLSEVRPHPGQIEASTLFRYLLEGSKLAYNEMTGHKKRSDGVRVQDAYSLRCLAQYNAVNFEKIKSIFETITINANSVSDNPLWVPTEHKTKGEKQWQWVSGGNFIAMHMVEAMDSLRKIMTQIVKINDRHLARLIDISENNGLPPNLSDKKAVTQCAFKGVQVQAGMYEVYSMLLSVPVSTFFGTHEEGNQDITSHALTSGIIGLENLKLVRYSTAQNLLAVAQATDLRGGAKYLSPRTRPVYDFIRNISKYVEEERPLGEDIENVYQTIVDGSLMKEIRTKVLDNYGK
jgi:histidine ammonia-lyase